MSKPQDPHHPNAAETRSIDKADELRRAALEYHEFPTPGKMQVTATKQMVNQRDLALAYSPGVAAACEEIVADPAASWLGELQAQVKRTLEADAAIVLATVSVSARVYSHKVQNDLTLSPKGTVIAASAP